MICRTPLLVNSSIDVAKDIADYGTIVTALVDHYDSNTVTKETSEGKGHDLEKPLIGQDN